jgi:hypothetical protein
MPTRDVNLENWHTADIMVDSCIYEKVPNSQNKTT